MSDKQTSTIIVKAVIISEKGNKVITSVDGKKFLLSSTKQDGTPRAHFDEVAVGAVVNCYLWKDAKGNDWVSGIASVVSGEAPAVAPKPAPATAPAPAKAVELPKCALVDEQTARISALECAISWCKQSFMGDEQSPMGRLEKILVVAENFHSYITTGSTKTTVNVATPKPEKDIPF